ncbi:PTS sugar transporter subunit IIC, partial [bacterium]|nr:PTS sugar transporter subunit IIC [bacterium]
MDRLIAFLEKLASQRHVLALRDGMLGSIPIILVGSVFLLLGAQSEVLTSYFGGQVAWLPNWVDTSFGQWYLAHCGDFYMPYRLTMGLLGLYIAFTVASALATQYGMSPVAQGLGAVATLLVTSVPQKVEGQWMIALKPLGPDGIFLGIIVAIFTVEISRLFRAKETPKDEVSQSIPPAVMEAFRGFLPLLVSVSLIWL